MCPLYTVQNNISTVKDSSLITNQHSVIVSDYSHRGNDYLDWKYKLKGHIHYSSSRNQIRRIKIYSLVNDHRRRLSYDELLFFLPICLTSYNLI